MDIRFSDTGFRVAIPPQAIYPRKPRLNAVFDRDYAVALVALKPGINDREMAASVYGPGTPSKLVVETCRALVSEGAIMRRLRADGTLGNFLRED